MDTQIHKESINRLKDEERKKLLKLDESCHLRGLKYSTQLIALVAYHYDTTLPENGNKLVVCHGCMNPSCSNPNHMYWGTKKDNKLDDYELGGHKTIYQNMVKKYGETKSATKRIPHLSQSIQRKTPKFLSS